MIARFIKQDGLILVVGGDSDIGSEAMREAAAGSGCTLVVLDEYPSTGDGSLCLPVIPRDWVDDSELFISFFERWRWFKSESAENRSRQEAAFKTMIALMFNIYTASYKRRAMFSKSGFIGQVAKRRKA